MSSILKENELPAGAPAISAARPAANGTRSDETANRPQPVALEVPVTVNGARAVDGSDKREPFSETTKTVLVFGNGAVIRLASPVAAGQLLFLTNEKTKKEVVCQVVKSKNYRNVSGYVELEFTEPVVGFWGMRFPNDRVAPKAGMPAASVTPEAVKAPPALPKLVEPPIAKVKPAELKPVEVSVRPPEAPARAVPPVAKPEIPVIPVPGAPPASISNLPRASDAKPAAAKPLRIQAQAPAPKNPEPAAGSTEALKRETARLQEELSSMLFSPAPA